MHRLVIALTAFLTLLGAVVVAGYLFIFSAQQDRTARAVPAETAFYANIFLQPSPGQKLNLAALLGRVPGFADAASLDLKIHDISARLLGETGLDYEGNIRPWLGDQISMAVTPDGIDPERAEVLVVVGVEDPVVAAAALERIAEDLQLSAAPRTHEGTELMVTEDGATAWALLDDVLLAGSSADVVTAGLDADADRAPSLADSADFERAMESIPPDHLASVFVDLELMADASGVTDQMGGYSTAGLALVVERDGLRLAGSAPFDADAAPAQAREAFALASEPSSLAEWMPGDTQAELVVFGLSQTLLAAEVQLGGQDGADDIANAISQLRGVAALGLGISVDDDLLPLFDREAAVAIAGLEGAAPHGQLLLRPSDPAAAEAALARIRDALEERGASVDDAEGDDGQVVTTVEIPQLGRMAYAIRDGVVVAGLDADDVASALQAHSGGSSLAESERYRAAWELAGRRGGNEMWLDAGALLDAAGDDLGVTGEARDILTQVGAVALTAPANISEERSEFHVVLTVR